MVGEWVDAISRDFADRWIGAGRLRAAMLCVVTASALGLLVKAVLG